MPAPGTPLEKLGFLTIGLFDANDPRPGHETTLDVIALGEQLGFDSAFVRHRHLQYGISSPIAVLAAATQRTPRIQLGTAVIPLGWENPLRRAGDPPTAAAPPARPPPPPRGPPPAPASARRCPGTTSRPPSIPTPPTSRTSAMTGSSG